MTPLEELKSTIQKYMMLENTGIIKTLAAAVISNRLPTTPVWLFLVSNSSGGKSMLLDGLAEVEGIFELSDMTANTFVSGVKGKDGAEVGLLATLKHDFPVMVISDFTTYLQKESTQNDQIMSQFRLVYDGKLTKRFGTGVNSEWKGRMGLIAGVTPIIYIFNAKYAAMGERFMMYAMDQPDREEVTFKALDVVDEEVAKKDIRNAFKLYIDNIEIPKKIPDLDPVMKKAIVQLAELASRARSGVSRNENSRDHEIMAKPVPEMPMRMAKQLSNMARSFMVLNGSQPLTSEDQQEIYKMALDSIATQRKEVMIQLTMRARMNTEALANEIKLTRPSVEAPLEELHALNVVKRYRPISSGGGWEWELEDKYRELLSRFEHIKMTNEVLLAEEGEWGGEPAEVKPDMPEIDLGDPEAIKQALL